MTFIQKKIYYFEKPGESNTNHAAGFAIERARELKIKTIVVASTSGKTAQIFSDAMKGSEIELVVVSHVVGFTKPGEWEFSEETAVQLRKRGVRIVTGTHALSGLERAFSRSPKVGGGSRSEAVSEALRRIVAVGLKVAVECVLIAADQGVIDVNKEVVAVGGTASGADTVCVIRPAHTGIFFDLQVQGDCRYAEGSVTMAIAELKEALILLKRMPLLWLPGIVGGCLAAALWVTLNLYGTFFAGRFMVFFGLVLLIFTTGMLTVIRNNEGGIRELIAGGIRYYFRVLLPQVVIISGVVLIFILLMITFSLFGMSDVSIVTALTFGFMIPTIILTFFYDTAAIFEDRRVFESIQRSMRLVFANLNEVIAFLFIYITIFIGIVLTLIIIWEAFLFDKLEPISRYNETQLQSFSPDQLIAIIGPTGIWITSVILFFGIFLLLPILYCYKACFFKKLAGGPIIIQQPTTGEFDSKGRWYKY